MEADEHRVWVCAGIGGDAFGDEDVCGDGGGVDGFVGGRVDGEGGELGV